MKLAHTVLKLRLGQPQKPPTALRSFQQEHRHRRQSLPASGRPLVSSTTSEQRPSPRHGNSPRSPRSISTSPPSPPGPRIAFCAAPSEQYLVLDLARHPADHQATVVAERGERPRVGRGPLGGVHRVLVLLTARQLTVRQLSPARRRHTRGVSTGVSRLAGS